MILGLPWLASRFMGRPEHDRLGYILAWAYIFIIAAIVAAAVIFAGVNRPGNRGYLWLGVAPLLVADFLLAHMLFAVRGHFGTRAPVPPALRLGTRSTLIIIGALLVVSFFVLLGVGISESLA